MHVSKRAAERRRAGGVAHTQVHPRGERGQGTSLRGRWVTNKRTHDCAIVLWAGCQLPNDGHAFLPCCHRHCHDALHAHGRQQWIAPLPWRAHGDEPLHERPLLLPVGCGGGVEGQPVHVLRRGHLLRPSRLAPCDDEGQGRQRQHRCQQCNTQQSQPSHVGFALEDVIDRGVVYQAQLEERVQDATIHLTPRLPWLPSQSCCAVGSRVGRRSQRAGVGMVHVPSRRGVANTPLRWQMLESELCEGSQYHGETDECHGGAPWRHGSGWCKDATR
mmetsp:Transcript_12441/g.35375  ORF Transcript_12441/g.35375 Transcript_12441/m.35375 type:complete len:274 (-) Transcript_12441:38-859(-)